MSNRMQKAKINKIAVTKVNGKALFKNSLKPFLKLFIFSSIDNLNECRMECKKQKYIVKAIRG